MKDNHFEFWLTTKDGELIGSPVRCATDEGVIMQCHPAMKQSKIRHLCSLARNAPHHPVDITHFDREENATALVWSARIYWRNNHESARFIRDTK
jgi:hypothetical protein